MVRPTSAAGSPPEESNVTSGGTLSPAMLCPQHAQTHTHTLIDTDVNGQKKKREKNNETTDMQD